MTLIILAAMGLIWTLRYIYRTVYAETIKDGKERIDAADLFIIRAKYERDQMSQQEIDHWNTARWD